MVERRRFNRQEKAAMYLAADGRCEECGVELEPGWHGDHRTPYSRGGPTDVINGQALCPDCNLKKGNTMVELREWQTNALTRFLRGQENFLTVATPGAGKTMFALTAAQRLIELGEVERLVVVVPTAHLRKQWSGAAARLGVQLDHKFVNGVGAMARDFDGVVVTYAAVSSEPLLYRKLSSDRRTLVILDEIHHCGESDHLTWGRELKVAFEPARRRLLLSGTPFRSDKTAIPFVAYNDAGKCQPDINYDYGTALRDRSVVRPIEFLALDGAVRWREAGQVVAVALVDAEGDSLKNALGAALNPDGDWISSVLKRADSELTRHREDVPDAAGLVVAADQSKARRYAAMLERITGEPATVAISDEPDSSDRITEFASGTTRWIVAVQMVSEGVDIPRLAVGVYASRVRTEMFFRQVVGRFVRMRGLADETTATLLVPSIEPLIRYAQAIEKTVDAALKQDEDDLRREVKDDEQAQLRLDLVEPLDSSEAIHHSTILAGESFTDEELRRADVLLGSLPGLPPSLTAAQMAQILRASGAGSVVGTAVLRPKATTAQPVPLADHKQSMRRLLQRKVGRLHRLTEAPYSHIHTQLNRRCGDTTKTATAETLEERLTILDEWIGEHG